MGDGKAAEIEVRQLYELEDFGPGTAIERFRDLGMQQGARELHPNSPSFGMLVCGL
jgi:hypothetical protein